MLAEHADLRQGSVACWVALARCPVWPVFDFVVTSKVPQLPVQCADTHSPPGADDRGYSAHGLCERPRRHHLWPHRGVSLRRSRLSCKPISDLPLSRVSLSLSSLAGQLTRATVVEPREARLGCVIVTCDVCLMLHL